jgi:hypothetical protein
MAEKQAASSENSREASTDAGGIVAHLKHRLSFKTIIKEVLAGITDKLIPQGADELGNVVFSGSAYLPWPGKGHFPASPPPEQSNVEPAQQEHASTVYDGRYSATSSDPPHPWPSEIAEANRHLPGKDQGNDYDHGHDAGHSM